MVALLLQPFVPSLRSACSSVSEGQDLLNNSLTAIFTVGIAWGVVAFLQGLVASFTLNSIRLIESLVVLIFGFLIILPITIAAIWKPKISVAVLVVSFFLVECVAFADDGLRGVLLVAKKLALPNVLLVCGYVYAASVQRRTARW